MGHPKFPRKKFDTPLHPWKEDRIKSERELIKKYGLKSHREVWKAKTYLGKYRQQARELLAKIGSKDPQVKKESDQLLLHLTRMGILQAGSSLDDVLTLDTEAILSRRLQTLVYLKGFSSTAGQSRQLINHGHIGIGDRKVTIPSYMVTKDEEPLIEYTGQSPLNELSHPARPKTDMFEPTSPPAKPEETPSEPKQEKEPEKPEPSGEKPPQTKQPSTPEQEKTPEPKEKPSTEPEKPQEKPPEPEPKEKTPPKETKQTPEEKPETKPEEKTSPPQEPPAKKPEPQKTPADKQQPEKKTKKKEK